MSSASIKLRTSSGKFAVMLVRIRAISSSGKYSALTQSRSEPWQAV